MPGTRGKIRWRVFSIVIAPSLAASVALFIALAQDVLAASFLISNQKFKVSSERVEGTGLIQYGASDRRYDGKIIPVLVSGLKQSKTTGFCQSVVARDIPLIGTFTVKVTIKQVTARDTYSDVVQADDGTVTLKNTITGIAVRVARNGPGVKKGDNTDPAGSATEADSIVTTNSKEILLATSARISESSGGRLRFYKGINECF